MIELNSVKKSISSPEEGKYRKNLQTGIFSDIAGPKAKNTVLFFKDKKPRSRISTPRQSHVHSGYVFDTREPRILGSVGKTSPSLTLLVPFRPMFGRTDKSPCHARHRYWWSRFTNDHGCFEPKVIGVNARNRYFLSRFQSFNRSPHTNRLLSYLLVLEAVGDLFFVLRDIIRQPDLKQVDKTVNEEKSTITAAKLCILNLCQVCTYSASRSTHIHNYCEPQTVIHTDKVIKDGKQKTKHRKDHSPTEGLSGKCGTSQAIADRLHQRFCRSEARKPAAVSKRNQHSRTTYFEYVKRHWKTSWPGKDNYFGRIYQKLKQSISFYLDIITHCISFHSEALSL